MSFSVQSLSFYVIGLFFMMNNYVFILFLFESIVILVEQIKIPVHRNARCKNRTKNPNRQAIRRKSCKKGK